MRGACFFLSVVSAVVVCCWTVAARILELPVEGGDSTIAKALLMLLRKMFRGFESAVFGRFAFLRILCCCVLSFCETDATHGANTRA